MVKSLSNHITVKEDNWTIEIKPQSSWWNIDFKEIWRYRDLVLLFVRRDFVSVYKQTILGPLWFFIQPLFSTLVFTVIFGRVAEIPTDGIPPTLFYMSGIIAWNYFADCLTKTSATFTKNSGLFSKVYFPRIITPLSVVVSNMLKFSVQFMLFLGFLVYYYLQGADIHINLIVLLFPLLMLIMAGLGLGFGMIISSLTTKYRDLQSFVGFGSKLMMYASPIVYPLSMVEGKARIAILLNPMTSIIESFKYGFLGKGTFEITYLLYSVGFMLLIMLLGLLIFHKVEKNFIDTV